MPVSGVGPLPAGFMLFFTSAFIVRIMVGKGLLSRRCTQVESSSEAYMGWQVRKLGTNMQSEVRYSWGGKHDLASHYSC